MAAAAGAAAMLAAGAALTAEPEQPIRLGQTVEGRLQAGDRQQTDGSLFDTYVFDGQAGQTVVVEMSSRDFDAYVGLFEIGDRQGPLVYNDNAGRRGRDAALNYVLPKTGRYVIVANAVEAGEQGAYRLALKTAQAPTPVRPRVQGLAVGKAVRGELGRRSGMAPDGSLYDLYAFTAKAGQRVRLNLTSADFTTFLSVHRPGEAQDLAFARERGDREAELIFTAPSDGRYEVWANAATPGEEGRYVLRLTQEGAAAPAQPQVIAYADTVRGELVPGDARAADGSLYDLYRFRGSRGDEVTITMRSSMVEPFLSVRAEGQARELASAADDGYGGRDAELTFVLPADGAYEVWANTLQPRQSGDYILAIERVGKASAQVAENAPHRPL